MTQPMPIACPLGLRAFDSYKVDFKEAIKIMGSMDCGDAFVAMNLFFPLTPECTQPFWHIRTTLGNEIVIGADTGKGECIAVK